MKRLSIFLFLLLVVTTGCKKPTDNPVDDTKKLEDLIISDNFTWKTTREIQFSITAGQSQVISIKSSDGKILYHKGFYNQLEAPYVVEITVPATVEMLLVNGLQIPITSAFIPIDLADNSQKSGVQVLDYPTEGLLALWHFNETSGTQATDAQGGFNGEVTGGSWTPGINQNCISLSGENSRVLIPSNPDLNLTNDAISLSFWFKMGEIGNDGTLMFHNTKYIVRIDNHGKVNFALYNPTYKSVTTPWSERIIDADWHHVAATYDGETMKLYIDNELKASLLTSGNLNSRVTNVYIGSMTTSEYFGGLIDEAALYNRALTVEEINTIFTTIPNPGTGDANLVSWWPMNEFGGTNVPDVVGSNNGTLSGATWTTGVIDNCLSFNGESDNVNIPNNPSLVFTNTLTIMAWAKTRDYKEAKIAQKGDWDGHGIGGTKWTGWKGHIRLASGTSESIESTDGRPLLNEWYHIAVTYDGAVLKLYVNGQLNNSRNVSGSLNLNSRPASIGSDNGAQKFFNGLIDEVKFFNTALTQTEIQAAYNNQNVATDSDGDGIQDADDDFPNDPARAFINYFPAAGYGSLAFEDLWPGKGDYDFNDLVVDYNFEIITNANNKVSDVISNTVVRAIGAGYNNGYGFQFSGNQLASTDIFATGSLLNNDVVVLDENGLEADQNNPTIIVFDNAKDVLQSATGFVNVEQDAPYVEPDTVVINLVFSPGVYEVADLNLENFNPFLIVDGIRGKEVHLPYYAPTALADPVYFGTSDDNSDPATGRYYLTSGNLPWAINIAESFDYTIEKSEIISGYLHFGEWAESSGVIYADWYKDLSGYRNNSHIYQVPASK
jgi:LruC domain-containing protein